MPIITLLLPTWILAVFISLLTASHAQASAITVQYTDRNAWEAALPTGIGFEEEFFDDAALNPGVTFFSQAGGTIGGGVFNDSVAEDGGFFVSDTAWYFTSPIYGFGGYWDLGTTSGINITGHGINSVSGGVIPGTYDGGFWGFVSSTPISVIQVFLNGSNTTVSYTLDNMVYAVAEVPEPASIVLMSLGLVGLGFLRKKKQRRVKMSILTSSSPVDEKAVFIHNG